jgi:hypothetical protein
MFRRKRCNGNEKHVVPEKPKPALLTHMLIPHCKSCMKICMGRCRDTVGASQEDKVIKTVESKVDIGVTPYMSYRFIL